VGTVIFGLAIARWRNGDEKNIELLEMSIIQLSSALAVPTAFSRRPDVLVTIGSSDEGRQSRQSSQWRLSSSSQCKVAGSTRPVPSRYGTESPGIPEAVAMHPALTTTAQTPFFRVAGPAQCGCRPRSVRVCPGVVKVERSLTLLLVPQVTHG
jgi:hypothetical protein